MREPRRVNTRPALLAALLGAALAAGVACDAPPWLTMPSPEEHARRYFPAKAGSVHAECVCNDCHGETGSFAQFDCLACHTGAHANQAEVTASHAAVADFRWESGACYGCHRNGLGVDHEPIFPIATGSHAIAACTECHVQPGDRSVLGCAGCHGHEQAQMAAQHGGKEGYAFESRACLRCHPRGQGGD